MTVIIHNHRIHYKDLLFEALVGEADDFVVFFAGRSVADRLDANLLRTTSFRRRYVGGRRYKWLPSASVLWRYCKLLYRYKPDVLVISGWYEVGSWIGFTYGLLNGVKLILWSESNENDHARMWLKEVIKRWYVRQFVVAHVYGLKNREYLVRLGMPMDRVYIKRAVLDVNHFSKVQKVWSASVAGERRKLIFVGRFVWEKNLPMLFNVLANLDASYKDRLSLLMVGYGVLEESLRLQCERLGLSRIVQFLGKRTQAELPELYAQADGFILPSVSEAWGLVVAEAMCVGLPVLISRQCGCSEDLVSQDTGWTFDCGSEKEIGTVIRSFIDAPLEELKRLGANGRSVALQYSPENCVKIISRSIELCRLGEGA